jgi:type VI secretion system protein ImpH
MGFTEGQAMADLNMTPDLSECLTKEGYYFNFFQALQLLEEKFRKEKGKKNPLDSGEIRLVPDSSLAFPASDIKQIKETQGIFELTLTFMGLVGVSSPLPLYFSEYLAQHEENSQPLIDFLTIFNHRCYSLFYRAWKKYRFLSSFSIHESEPIPRRIALLAGLDPKRLSDPSYARLLSYAGLLSVKCKGKSSIASMLSDFFQGLPVEIQEYQPRWVEILNPPRMGDSQLGINSIAGTSSWDISGKFRVAVGPLPRETFEQFLPYTDNIKKMKELISLYLSEPLAYDIEVKLQSSELVPVILGENNTRLGETSSLGESKGYSDIKSIVIE